MIRRVLADGVQLTNKAIIRSIASYGYLLLVGGLIIAANYASRDQISARPDGAAEVLYMVVVLVVLSSADVRMERGRLTLSAIGIWTAAMLFNPLNATVAGATVGIPMLRRGRWPVLGNSVMSAANACLGAELAALLRSDGGLTFEARLLVLAAMILASWILTAIGLSIRTGESVQSIVRHNFTAPFYLAFAYFALASLLTSYVLDGSIRGYALATIVFVLALALTDTIATRRLRRVLESELSDADRHLFHSRAVEGVVHNLRNHMATAVGYLKEIDTRHLDPVDRDAIETAKAAANDAVTVLQSLSQGATPRVTYAAEPVDLNELVGRALDMARPRARAKHIELGLHETPDAVKVRADPLLLREVATNLVNNAIDAAPQNGRIELSTGRRGNGWPFFTVADNGPGVADENRHHLFEPHFTTKEHGTGLGLFMSYGIVREHQGRLNYEGGRRGAAFTVELPPYPAEPRS